MDEQRRPAYFLLNFQEPLRRHPPGRDYGAWATIPVRAEVVNAIHIGSGVAEVVTVAGSHQLALGFARRYDPTGQWDRAVPGSSFKGAVRAVFEAITPSCNPLDNRAKCRGPELCPACTVFGMGGRESRAGSAAFGDLAHTDGEVSVYGVAQRFEPVPKSKRKLYSLVPEEPLPEQDEHLVMIDTGATLRGVLRLEGLPLVLAGALVCAAGLADIGVTPLRIGGAKNRGYGAIRLHVDGDSVPAYADNRGAWLRHDRRTLNEEVLHEWRESAEGAFDSLAERVEEIRKRMGRQP